MMYKKDLNRDLQLIDKYQESIYVYWSALLTINGLILTFFSIDALSPDDRLLTINYILIGSCILSLWLILWNFRTIKENYHKLGRLSIKDMPDVPQHELEKAKNDDEIRQLILSYTENWRKEDINDALNKNKYMTIRETTVESLLVLETLLIVIIIVQSS